MDKLFDHSLVFKLFLMAGMAFLIQLSRVDPANDLSLRHRVLATRLACAAVLHDGPDGDGYCRKDRPTHPEVVDSYLLFQRIDLIRRNAACRSASF